MSHTDLQGFTNVKQEARELENSPESLYINIELKQEPDDVAEGHTTDVQDLYTDHEIKEEMVIGPVVMQAPVVGEAKCVPSTSDKLNTRTRIYKCKICNVGFVSRHVLKCHRLIHIGKQADENVSNEFCHLKCDLITRSAKRLHKCEHCNKSFTSNSNLNIHLLTHTGDKPHKCEHCNKLFNQKSSLNRHLLTHSGEKPHKCEHCDKSFNQKSTLNAHLITHTAEKPHNCDRCDKSFNSKSNLSRHLTTHIEEKPYKCEHCNKSYKCKYNFKKHLLSHTGEKPQNSE